MPIYPYTGWSLRGVYRFFVITVCMVCLIGVYATASAVTLTSAEAKDVGTLESTLYSIQYEKESPEDRLNRLETTVFGQVKTGQSFQQRLERLNKALDSQLEPLKNQAESVSTGPATKIVPAPAPAAATKQPGESDYPVVSQMEQKVFGRAFTQEPLASRLTRLEMQVFKTEQRGELVDRTDNLRLMVLGDTGNVTAGAKPVPQKSYYVPGYSPPAYASMPVNTNSMPSQAYQPQVATRPASTVASAATQPYRQTFPTNPDEYYQTAVNNQQAPGQAAYQPSPYSVPSQQAVTAPYAGQGYQQPSAAQQDYSPAQQGEYYGDPVAQAGNSSAPTPDMEQALGEVEKQVLKTTYPAEPFNARLDRLENQIFHSTSPELGNEERLQRVLAVAAADGSNPTAHNSPKSMVQTLLPIILTILPMLLL